MAMKTRDLLCDYSGSLYIVTDLKTEDDLVIAYQVTEKQGLCRIHVRPSIVLYWQKATDIITAQSLMRLLFQINTGKKAKKPYIVTPIC